MSRCSPSARFRRFLQAAPRTLALGGALAVSLTGCTPLREYLNNGFKVGPDYKRPPAPVAERWIDADDMRVRSEDADLSQWWAVFNDPALNTLVKSAYEQNISLREAGFRVLAARARLGIARGELFPQQQGMSGSYTHIGLSTQVANRQFIADAFYDQWDYGFGMSWELDFWGRFRRSIEASRAELNASVENFDDVLVTLIGDVATNYVRYRTLERRIFYARTNADLQDQTLRIATGRFKGGQASELDVNQAQSDLSRTLALIPQLEIQLREVNNRLCILLGIPPEELKKKLGDAPIPHTPVEAVVGIPADLLRRRPDVRRAERLAAAQSARIGVADAQFYPAISITGNFGWSAEDFGDLFTSNAFQGRVGPSFNWPLLNYGRILNNVRLEDARFQEAVANYQNTVLRAQEEVENGLVQFLKSQQRYRSLVTSVDAELRAVKDAIAQYQGGLTDFNRVAVIQERLVDRQEELAIAHGDIALGLIQVYRALGGGWQLRCNPDAPPTTPLPTAATSGSALPQEPAGLPPLPQPSTPLKVPDVKLP